MDDLRRMAAEALGGTPDDYVVEMDERPILYRTQDIPVVDGIATLPDGRTVHSTANAIRVPYLTPEDQERLAALMAAAEDDE